MGSMEGGVEVLRVGFLVDRCAISGGAAEVGGLWRGAAVVGDLVPARRPAAPVPHTSERAVTVGLPLWEMKRQKEPSGSA